MKPICKALLGEFHISLLVGDVRTFEQRVTEYAKQRGLDANFIFYLPQGNHE